jgi:hypothetical protein
MNFASNAQRRTNDLFWRLNAPSRVDLVSVVKLSGRAANSDASRLDAGIRITVGDIKSLAGFAKVAPIQS